ncbi:hypothetical protein MYRA21_2785 [Myroides sp. A21]|uniref:HNH endonuclease n=1 Tax=Myroides sp. A21 TaxID=1583100 RepID=UPI00057E8598|nr:HNH endonuclease [Myroides sp. A21]AJA69894.1 hypothetical protein MYRA21_2785 [Myroides sp. A21]
MEKNRLYDFSELIKFLDKKGFPNVEKPTLEIIREDLTQKQKEGKVEFKEDGIYLLHNNIWHKGYMYIKNADVNQYGLPKYHILECKTIKDQKSRDKFDNHYYWSNESHVDVRQRNSNQEYKEEVLDLCKNCAKEAKEIYYNTTELFHNSLNLDVNYSKKVIKIDINGYDVDWHNIKRKHQEEKNFLCEECGIDLQNDKRFIEVIHKDDDKTNNMLSNLRCLCLGCLANSVSKSKLSKAKLEQVKAFKNKYDGFYKSKNIFTRTKM